MKKTFILIAVMALLAVTPIISQSSATDARSTELLNKVSSTYKAFKTLSASFKVNMKNKQSNSAVNQSGKLFVKGKKFKVVMAGQEIYCDGKTVWTYLPDVNEVSITNYDEATMDISPSSIFTIHEKGFIHKYSGQKTLNGEALDLVDMTPTDKKKPYFKVSLSIQSKQGTIKDMSVHGKNGVTTAYTITKFASNTPLKDSFFKFNPASKPGVVEIDFR